MTYLTKCKKEFIPSRRLLINITAEGRYQILLRHNNVITYKDRDSFEQSLLEGSNKFFLKINKDFSFLDSLLGVE